MSSEYSHEDLSADDSYTNHSTGETTATSADLPEEAVFLMMQQMPTMLTIAILIYFIIAPIVMLKPSTLQSGSGFLMNQMLINSSLLVTFSVLYGMLTIFFNKSIVTTHQNIILPLVLIGGLWVKSYLTYQNSLYDYCTEVNGNGKYNEGNVPYKWQQILWNTSKVSISIFVTYIFIILFPQSVIPFNQFFCGEATPHPLVVFFSIGFWTGCATWAGEASCYFSLLQSGCQPADKINFESIDQVIRNYDKEDDG
jgi:hypothetical protein